MPEQGRYLEIQQELYAQGIVETPLVPLALSSDAAEGNILLKLENLQPQVRCYKIRGAMQALLARSGLSAVITASAGNFAQGLALACRKRKLPLTVLVPENASLTKLARISGINPEARILPISPKTWWKCLVSASAADVGLKDHPSQSTFISPTTDTHVIDGNTSIGMELVQARQLRQARDIHIYVPYGGGGLLTGIAYAMRATSSERPNCRVKFFACEVESAAPLRAALMAGAPQTIEVRPSWIDGIGAPSVLPTAFKTAQEIGCASLVVSEAAVAHAGGHLLNRLGMVVEGAGAVSLAAAWQHASPSAYSVCIISGGNIDVDVWRSWIASS